MKKNDRRMDMVTKMALIGGVGMVLIVILIFVLSLTLKNDDKETQNPVSEEAVEDEEVSEDVEEEAEYIRAMAVIKDVDSKNGKLTVLDIDTEEELVLEIDGAVDIKDEFGTLLTLAQLDVGDIVETKYDKNSMRPENVHITAQIWERKSISKLVVNSENKTIQIANDIYQYTDHMVTNFLGNSFELSELDPVDEVTVKGYKDTIWSITLEKTHGYIVLANHSKFIGGTIEIGKMTVSIEEETKITVPVGVHNVIIAKEGMTSFITQALVEENKEMVIDVGEVKAEVGMVSFVITPTDVDLYINDVLYPDLSEPITLDYGIYAIRIEKESYVPWESQLSVNQAYMSVEIDMDEEPMFLHVDNPVGTELYVDGNYIGEIPIDTPIDAGAHTLTLRKDGFYSKMYNIQIESNGEDSYFTFPELIEMPAEETEDTTNEETTDGDTTTP